MAEKKRLGDLLIEAGKITQTQLDTALAAQEAGGGRLGDILVKQGAVSAGVVEEVMKSAE